MFTIPDFGRHGANIRRQTNGMTIVATHYVNEENRLEWEMYTVRNNYMEGPIVPFIYEFSFEAQQPVPITTPGPWAVVWQADPLPIFPIVNVDAIPNSPFIPLVEQLKYSIIADNLEAREMLLLFPNENDAVVDEDEPIFNYLVPIFDRFDDSRHLVGILSGVFRWGLVLSNILPQGAGGIIVVLDSGQCGSFYTWRLEGREAIFIGRNDSHDRRYDDYMYSAMFGSYENPQEVSDAGGCLYSINVFPSKALESLYKTQRPLIIAVCVAFVFTLLGVAFFSFDYFQNERNRKVLQRAAVTGAIVNSMFPSEFRSRLVLSKNATDEFGSRSKKETFFASNNQRIMKFLDGDEDAMNICAKPLADFFPAVTIMFADLVGFTAWCSVREPSQVFMLLETLYSNYDDIARKMRVFKVESVGDCYVAAAGLPDKRPDHAVVMVRFARACLKATSALMARLEVQLGPDTGDLTVRIGLHSGPITAGVLRGERARFQLFGDTMNVASRMESTGLPGCIHVSEETANLLFAANKGQRLQLRSDEVNVKGKGTMRTYFLEEKLYVVTRTRNNSSTADSEGSSGGECEDQVKEKRDRLVDWHVDLFSKLLNQILQQRENQGKKAHPNEIATRQDEAMRASEDVKCTELGATCLDEVQEIIVLPRFSRHAVKRHQDESIKLDDKVVRQLRDYILTISMMYRENAFHNFEHASHVTMSVSKLLARIVMPSDLIYEVDERSDEKKIQHLVASTLHDHTYGITSDPLTQFAVVFAALIHDVDHTGVPNIQLMKENPKLAYVFKNQSVAEQNSIVLAWDLLMNSNYVDLRSAIYATKSEQARFRQLLVQTVLATDIADKELKKLRNARWEKAFQVRSQGEDPITAINRKATIVIEHLIQASDVAHTMQHWHIYRKWNQNFFVECYQAFLDGRSEADPSLTWYEAELGFFDFYIIPLANKLKECGVFGVCSDEYLNYATRNRIEWEDRGREVVAEMMRMCQARVSM